MKQILLGLLLLIAAGSLSAQCTPDPQYTSSGIYPDSATNFLPAYIGQPYEQIVTAVVPQDTCVIIFSPPCQTVTIDSILVTSVSGLPPNFTYICDQPNCAFYGGQSGCMKIYSTSDPTISDTGRYDLTITLTTYSFVQQNDVIDYYFIDVMDSSGTNVPEVEEYTIELYQNEPNPVDDITNIKFMSGSNSEVTFTVFNVIGEAVHSEQMKVSYGENTIRFNAGKLRPGIYLYSIDNGYVKYSKKMVVK